VLPIIAGQSIAGGFLWKEARDDARASANDGPEFEADSKLVRPTNYRRWAYVSSGFGMSYEARGEGSQDPPLRMVS